MSELRSSRDVVRDDLSLIRAALDDELDRLAGKHLLITGGAGFLGYYLVQAVLGRDIRLTVFDNYIRGVPRWLDELAGRDDLTVVEHDVRRPLPDGLPAFRYIIHAASIASPTYYRQHPIETMDANVNGLRHLLDYCRGRQDGLEPVEGMLFFSTSEIYGDPPADEIPTSEDYRGHVSCTGPRACYDESKRFGETLCVNFAAQYGVPVAIARPFNNYGPGLKITDRRVIPDFARDLLAGRDIVMLSDGSPSRTFCYITDAVSGYYKILTRGRPGEPYNIGTERPEISMAQLAEKMVGQAAELYGYEGKVVRETSPDAHYLADNPNRRCPDIAKARAELGYEPQMPVDDGLRRSLIWYADHREADEA